ncbi:ComEC/Rec2 family competence protein [Stappia indica]|uniref:DUF4131 domain-containing protein n=1 Tax=Stappia indica TaxID=538381 RepID=A0A857C378_9HYPH|nr:ComEC/Rec2 family competence protein [Stappia indica]QGZ33329.1 DUF4131 domain-containing protein [Stappia indica]
MVPDTLPDTVQGRRAERRWLALPALPLADLLARRRRARTGWHEPQGPGTRFAAAASESLAQGRGLAYAALAFTLGIAVYFRLPAEPLVLVLAPAAALAWAGWFLAARRGASALPLLVLALVLSGVFTGALRTELVGAPVIDRARSVTLTGFVEEAERTDRGTRLLLRVAGIERLAATATPYRVRVSLRGGPDGESIGVGEGVRLRARLMPPSAAVIPGGYDFAFRAFFDGIGATGFAFGAPSRVDLGPAPVSLRLKAGVAHLRLAIAARILEALGETTAAALAIALITGDRSLIPEPVTEALRTAGLAHILAISGLHMALFAGSVFFVVRGLLALSSHLVQERRIDAWAAVAAMSAAVFYLGISGGSIATQRAFVMIVLVFCGRIFARRALTLRNVAIAVFLILAVLPEALLDPGFQMSFAAVIALVAAYEEITRRRAARERKAPMAPPGRGLLQAATSGAAGWFWGLLLTSLIAGLATGAIGAYHFHRISPLGTLGNLLAMPVVTLVVMPFAVLALALLPFGLEALPLAAMGAGIDLVVAMATWVSGLTPDDGVIGAPSLAGTLAVVAAGLIACLAPRGYRPVALLPLAASVLLYAQHRQPDMLISANGTTIAVRDAAGDLRVSSRPSGFLPEVWLRADGVGVREHGNRRISAKDMHCDKLACLVRAHGSPGAGTRHGTSANAPPGPRPGPGSGSGPEPRPVAAAQGPPALLVSLVRDSAAFEEDCRKVDIIVSALIAPPDCRARQVFDGARLARDGAVALYFSAPDSAPDFAASSMPEAGPSPAPRSAAASTHAADPAAVSAALSGGSDAAPAGPAGVPAGPSDPVPPEPPRALSSAHSPKFPPARQGIPHAGAAGPLDIAVRPSYGRRRPWTPK